MVPLRVLVVAGKWIANFLQGLDQVFVELREGTKYLEFCDSGSVCFCMRDDVFEAVYAEPLKGYAPLSKVLR